MPTVFDQPEDGDVTHVAQINQYAPAVNALERGLPFSAGTTAGTSTAYTATVNPGPADNEFGTLLVVYWHVDCGTDPTLALNGHAPLSIWKTEIAKVASGELKAGTFSLLQCNGTKWFVLQQIGGSSGSTNASTAFSSGQVPLARGGTGADLSATGGSSQFLKQTSAGGAVSVAGILANDLPANIDCAKFANGQVSNTEFQYLDGVTSGIQSQIDGKAASSHNHAASAITSGQLALAQGGTGADLSATGGTGQVLKQSSAGGTITVGTLTYTDVGAAASSHTHTISQLSDWPAGLTVAELGYMADVTSLVQAQLNGKMPAATGSPDGTKFLGDDGSWKAASATDATKMPLAGGTFSGNVIFNSAIQATGSPTTLGTTTRCIHSQGTTDRWNFQMPSSGLFVWEFGASVNAYIGSSFLNLNHYINFANPQTAPSPFFFTVYYDAVSGTTVTSGSQVSLQSRLVSRANSTAYNICPWLTGDRIRIELEDDADKSAEAIVSTAGVVTFAPGSHADYVASSTPASGEVGVYTTGGNVVLKPGSAAGRKIAAYPKRSKV